MAIGVATLDRKKVIIISLYLDIKESPTPSYITKALQYCKQRGYSAIFGSDTNSHSTIWGLETNKRGEKLEELIEEYQLDVRVHNRGMAPTYECELGKSIIDVIFSYNLKLNVENWRVCKIYNNSDHHSLNYTLKTEILELPPVRPYSTARGIDSLKN